MDEHFYHRDVENISERWRVHNLRQYTAEVFFGESSGNTFGNEELTFEQRFYTSPINNHFRAYARHRYEYAQFPEGNGYLNRVGVGAEYRSKSYDVNAELNGSTRDSSDPGITLSGVWRLGDHLSFSGEAQTFSRLVPLRGNNDDVEGKSVTVGARYRWNETHDLRVSAGFADFDDGNERKFFFIKNQHGIYQSAHHQLSLSQEFYTSENDEVEAFYFNPERDHSVRIAGIYDGVIWRRYTRKWAHQLTLGLGNYKQRGESSAGIWDLAYLHHWQIDPTLEFKYGYIHRRRTYDGDPESFNAGIASLNWRF
jgi:biofilm PGA synthesis protein PgaA